MSFENVKAFVTGANRGIGRQFVEQLLQGGAQRVYAGVRDPASLEALAADLGGRLVVLPCDVTDEAQVAQAAARAGDVNLLVNNAGVLSAVGVLDPEALTASRRDLEVNHFGMWRVAQAFAPALVRNAPGAMLNVCSLASFVNFPAFAGYCVSKAAAHSLTQALRAELEPQGVAVLGIYPGPIETDMVRDLPFEQKADVAETVARCLAAWREGQSHHAPDAMADSLLADLLPPLRALETKLHGAPD